MQKKTFKQLSIYELYALIKLRQDVFVVEQNSIYSDLDDLDQTAIHFLDLTESGELLGYARYRKMRDLVHYKIERVVLSKKVRGGGKGKVILQAMINDIKSSSPQAKISLSAQTNAIGFYHFLGFVEQGETYDDGGIEHITMVYTA